MRLLGAPKRAVFSMMGILCWVFVLSLALAWYDLGGLDPGSVGTMGLMLVLLLAAASGVLLFTGAREDRPEEKPVPGSGGKRGAR